MFFSKRKDVRVSICVPVCGSEKTLLACLESVKIQNFADLEVIVVDDCSYGRDSAGRNCKQIVKAFSKCVDFEVKYIFHNENKGAVESRRTALYEAKGKYVFFMDSDDSLIEGSIQTLYAAATENGAQLVHGKALLAAVNSANSAEEIQKSIIDSIQLNHPGILTGKEILDGWLKNRQLNGFLWAKLYDRELLLDAFNHIPSIFCVMSEDFLITFWVLFEAAKQNLRYIGIDSFVYNYYVQDGISSRSKVTSIEQWQKNCTAASVFTLVFSSLQEMLENPEEELVTQDLIDLLHKYCNSFLLLNLKTLYQNVIPELQKDAYTMLCDWWGEDFVEQIAKHL